MQEVWDASGVEGACSDCSWPILTYQAILLHIIFALLQRGGGSMGLDLKPSLPSPDSGASALTGWELPKTRHVLLSKHARTISVR